MLELYYYENSVCAERAVMALAEKGIADWVPRHVHLFKGEQFSPEYMKLNPKAVVPTLVHEGHVICESALICDYVDDLRNNNPLKPSHPAEVARMREWVKDCDDYVFEAVSSLSFVSVFRARMLQMEPEQRAEHWRKQSVLDRALRQAVCVEQGLDSPYVIRAIASWERAWARIEASLDDGRPWLMGEQFTLADLCYAPFVARIAGLQMLEVWLDQRPLSRAWYERLSSRPAFLRAEVGPSQDERQIYAREGARVVDGLKQRLQLIREGKGLALALAAFDRKDAAAVGGLL